MKKLKVLLKEYKNHPKEYGITPDATPKDDENLLAKYIL